jgi:hypothetical protein
MPYSSTVVVYVLLVVFLGTPESPAEIVNETIPARVGVPLKTPAALSVNPVGIVLALAEKVYGERPPLAVRFAL